MSHYFVASHASVGAIGVITCVLGRAPLAHIASAVASSLIMSIAAFMTLNELNIAPEIIMVTCMAIIDAVALGRALAFGLGHCDVAARLLGQAYVVGKNTADKQKANAKCRK